MKYAITWFEKRKLRKIAKRIATQSHQHQKNITEYYRVMTEVAKNEFYEDNSITVESFLRECLEESFKTNNK